MEAVRHEACREGSQLQLRWENPTLQFPRPLSPEVPASPRSPFLPRRLSPDMLLYAISPGEGGRAACDAGGIGHGPGGRQAGTLVGSADPLGSMDTYFFPPFKEVLLRYNSPT